MFKYLIENGYVNVPKIILSNYAELGLSGEEAVVILKLFEMLKNNQVNISVSQLAKQTNMEAIDLGNLLGGLYDRDYITISLEQTKQGKTKESFNLDNFIAKLEEFLEKKRNDELLKNNESANKEVVSLVEETFKRMLSPSELSLVVEWVSEGETIQRIRQALALAVSANKLNLKYVDSCLQALKRKTDEVVLDDNKSKLLEDFYRNIR